MLINDQRQFDSIIMVTQGQETDRFGMRRCRGLLGQAVLRSLVERQGRTGHRRARPAVRPSLRLRDRPFELLRTGEAPAR